MLEARDHPVVAHDDAGRDMGGVEDADEDALYAAMDWLGARAPRIEAKLAAPHLDEGAEVLYDVSSSYFEGRSCPLVRFGHSRDGKRGRPIVVYGVLTDAQGRPVAVEVYPGNTGDPSTVTDQVDKLKDRFGLERVVLVEDRGMLMHTQITALQAHEGIGWLLALRHEKVRALIGEGALQRSLFDEYNLAEIHSPDFPDERLIACYNPLLAEERRRKRKTLLAATEAALDKIRAEVARRTRTPLTAAEIGKKVGRVINRHKMAKHFKTTIADGAFSYRRDKARIAEEAALDGIYVIRTSEPVERLSAKDSVRRYKNLAQLEQVFAALKGLDLRIRPIHHRAEERVRAHIFICLLAYYVEWHLRGAFAPLLFDDEELVKTRAHRDPVAPAEPSAAARQKKTQRRTDEGLELHSFATLMAELGTRGRHRCRLKSEPDSPVIVQDNEPSPLQARALELIRMFPVTGT